MDLKYSTLHQQQMTLLLVLILLLQQLLARYLEEAVHLVFHPILDDTIDEEDQIVKVLIAKVGYDGMEMIQLMMQMQVMMQMLY